MRLWNTTARTVLVALKRQNVSCAIRSVTTKDVLNAAAVAVASYAHHVMITMKDPQHGELKNISTVFAGHVNSICVKTMAHQEDMEGIIEEKGSGIACLVAAVQKASVACGPTTIWIFSYEINTCRNLSSRNS